MTTPLRFIRPTTVTDAILTSSTVPEADHAAWNAATSYTLGQRVMRVSTHSIYECVLAGVNATAPELAPTRWLRVGPTNRWAMFDRKVGTATTASDSLTVVMAPGRINSIALLQVDAALVTVSLAVAGVEVYAASMNLISGNIVGDWYQYFYEPVYQQDNLVLTDFVDATLMELPAYGEAVLTVTLSRPGGAVSCGGLIVGLYANLGLTTYSPKIGIVDYSRKAADDFGNYDIRQRSYSKRMSLDAVVQRTAVDQVARVLAQYRATPLVWVGAGNTYTSMVIYGFYKDWDISIDNYSVSTLSLQIEGMT